MTTNRVACPGDRPAGPGRRSRPLRLQRSNRVGRSGESGRATVGLVSRSPRWVVEGGGRPGRRRSVLYRPPPRVDLHQRDGDRRRRRPRTGRTEAAHERSGPPSWAPRRQIPRGDESTNNRELRRHRLARKPGRQSISADGGAGLPPRSQGVAVAFGDVSPAAAISRRGAAEGGSRGGGPGTPNARARPPARPSSAGRYVESIHVMITVIPTASDDSGRHADGSSRNGGRQPRRDGVRGRSLREGGGAGEAIERRRAAWV